ncbi:MAG: tetratricopeptide repeat protein [Deltaproteobacteria bacterium]|nr:tetratricopeptide repeat protein [Deltaproteobacteria bacterium]NIS76930.1 tetratricopeptide repeat protein [Deltaproteobacteria bacterium]
MAKKRLTKKELKQPDEVLTLLGTATRFITENQAKLMAVAGSIFVLALAIYGYKGYTSRKFSKENGKLWQIVARIPDKYLELSEGEKQNLVLVKSDLENFLKKVGSKSVKIYAQYYIADVNFKLAYYSNAVEKFQEILGKEEVPPELRYISNIGLGYSYEALSEYKSAIRHFKAAGDMATDPYSRGAASYGMARCYELMGDFEVARQIYADILEKNPDYPDIEFIKIRLSSIS